MDNDKESLDLFAEPPADSRVQAGKKAQAAGSGGCII